MCCNPIDVPGVGPIACRKCWQCLIEKREIWVGKLIAEMQTTQTALFVTLTYGRDQSYGADLDEHPGAYRLRYRDVQLYLKRLRKLCPDPIRFFAMGEYGKMKGRAHWHLILYFQGRLPKGGITLQNRYLHEPWPHGYSWFEEASPRNARYCAKYLFKDAGGDTEQKYTHSSRYPPLGTAYFDLQARELALQYLSPQDTVYSFADDYDGHGKRRWYQMTASACWRYALEFSIEFRRLHGHENWPASDFLDAFVDERARRSRRLAGEPDQSDVDWIRRYYVEREGRHIAWATKNELLVEGANVVRLYPSTYLIDRQKAGVVPVPGTLSDLQP